MARPPSAKSIIKNLKKDKRSFEPKTPIATEMFLPNNSGIAVHPEFLKHLGDNYVPYTGANDNVDLGAHNFTTTGTISSGDMGIGTSTPTSILDVVGGTLHIQNTGNFESPTSGEGFEVGYDANGQAGSASGGSGASIFQSYDRDSSAWRDVWFRGNNIQFDANGSLAVYIQSDGKVGIGTDTPAEALDLNSGNLKTTGAILGGGAGHDQFSDFAANEHIDWTNAANNLLTSGTGQFGNIKLDTGTISTTSGDLIINPVGDDVSFIDTQVGIGKTPVFPFELLAPTGTAVIAHFTGNKAASNINWEIENAAAANTGNNARFGLLLKTSSQTRTAFEFRGYFNNITDGSRNSLVTWRTADGGSFGNVMQFDGHDVFIPNGTLEVSAKIKLTAIGGYAIKLTNKTGANSVQGEVVRNSAGTDDAVSLAVSGETNAIGVFLEAGVSDGSEAWVVVGGIADVLADTAGFTRGDRLVTSITAATVARGTANNSPSTAVHFQEMGHAIETAAGNALGRCVLHFN